MNPQPDLDDNPEAIRSEIEETRHRMDHTIDALGDRLKGRQLVDEALHFFRTQQDNGNLSKMKNKLSSSADSAFHSVVDTIKSNPMPFALIGAGTAWYLFTRNRSSVPDAEYNYEDYSRGDYGDLHFASVATEAAEGQEIPASAGEDPSEAGSSVTERVREGASQLGARASETVKSTGEKIGKMGREVRERSQDLYERGRRQVVTTAQEHPLEAGLVCLAVGFIGGLLLPAPKRLRQAVAPKARELRERAGDMIERGKKVIASGAEAAKKEAKTQGITLDARTEGEGSPASAPAEAGAAI